MALFLLFLSLFNVIVARPFQNEARDITEEEYMAYLKEYFPETDKYLLYTGHSMKQVQDFIEEEGNWNQDYRFFADFFLPDALSHPWYTAFNSLTQKNNQTSASIAIARVMTKQVLLFGGIQYATVGKDSVYTKHEYPILIKRIEAGELPSIQHMARDALSPSEIMATEDATGTITWAPGYEEGMTNASPLCDSSSDEEDEIEHWERKLKRWFLSLAKSTGGRGRCCSGRLCWKAVDPSKKNKRMNS